MNTYEKKYKEALERAKTLYENANGMILKKWVEQVFPELAESQDEKIRKWIIDDIMYNMNNEPLNNSEYKKQAQKALAWLEKQGKKKDINPTLIEKEKMDNANKVVIEPKFKVGDWITNGSDCTFQIASIENGMYYDTNNCGSDIENTDKYYYLWTIADAKDGDVLSAHECIVVFKEIDGLNIKCHCTFHYMNNPSFHVDTLQNKTAFHPATKEQRDALMKAMTDAGYTIDFDKKELKLLITNGGDFETENCEQKPAKLSEEDKIRLDRICKTLWKNRKGDTDEIFQQEQDVDWLKSLKDRVQPQSQPVWSEEDEDNLNLAIYHIRCDDIPYSPHDIEPIVDWLKQIKQRMKE